MSVSEEAGRRAGRIAALLPHVPVAIALALLTVPTLIRLGEQTWSREVGAHGPIVLMTGGWLLWRRWADMRAEASPGHQALTLLATFAALGMYVFGRAYDFISMEAAGLYGFGLALMHQVFGVRVLLQNWFPIFYLAFLLPIPGWLLDSVTAPLKLFVSLLATAAVEPFGIPIVREGVTLVVGTYQLLVEDACSGMNSLIGLVAITLFYIYLLRDAGWRYLLFLTSLIIPIAILANVLRIVILILLTYFLGDSVGQGFLHVTAGLFLFALSLGLMFVIDSTVARLFFRRKTAA